MKRLLTLMTIPALIPATNALGQLQLSPDVEIPVLANFQPLPEKDADFEKQITELVIASGLDQMTPAAENPDEQDEWSSIMVVDLSNPSQPKSAGWKEDNFIYPASSYKLYVLGEVIRRVVAGDLTLDDTVEVAEHNVRTGSRLEAGDQPSISEVMRLMMMYSDNTAANVAIDIADRQRASALLRAMDLEGSDITRKYLSRSLEDEGYAEVPGTESTAEHFATFLYAVETGAIGGGEGRGLIKGYMGTIQTGQNRMRAGLPDTATLYSKTGTWSIFSSQVSIIEDGPAKYILCVLTPYKSEIADGRIADFTSKVHALMVQKAKAE